MNRSRALLTIITLLSITLASAQDINEVAEMMSRHKFRKVHRLFTSELQGHLSRKELKKVWYDVEHSAGELKDISEVRIDMKSTSTVQSGILNFDRGAFRFIVGFNEEKRINTIFIRIMGYQLPDYGRDRVSGRKLMTISTDTFIMGGELTIPIQCNECPLVILVHGSGPLDRDETVGPNKVFKDLALGLAEEGVATFRYDKRTMVYPQLLEGQFDIYDETVDDAISAYRQIVADTSLHFGKVIFLGHSLGAFSMPMIVDSLVDVDGAILFSANARRLEEIIEYQMNYLTGWDGKLNKAEKRLVKNVTLGVERIRSMDYDTTTPQEDLPAYWPGSFWRSIANYDPVTAVQQNKSNPYLVLQGEKDYQITMTDFEIWNSKVGNQKNVTLHSFPGLTHLFTPTSNEKPGPADYFVPGNVDHDVILYIAKWIDGLP